ncbi:MAG: peptidoglycan-binding protein [Gammaproteobacteria bacterium]
MSIKPRNTNIVTFSALGLFALGSSFAHADEVSSQLINIQSPIATSIGLATGTAVATAPIAAGAAMNADLLPPNATPGQCYARIWLPPKFQNSTETVETKPAGESLEIIPATYETVTERVLVKEASQKLVGVPATYGTASEKVLVKDAELHWHYGRNGVSSARDSKTAHPADAYLNYARSLGMSNSVQPGQCYAEYIQPAKYSNVTERMLKSEASQRIEVIPATYETVEERMLVSDASEKLVTIPETYGTITEKVLVKPAYTTWKVSECSGGACETGSVPNRVAGSVDRIDRSTGEIMCLVEIPAQYKTITKRVLKTPATTKTVTTPAQYKVQKIRKLATAAQERVIAIPETYQTITKTVKSSDPVTSWHLAGSAGSKAAGHATGNALCLTEKPAVYKTVSRQVVKTPASTRTVEIPAEYKTVSIRKLVTSPQERRTVIPAQYGQVTKTERVSEGHMEWKPVLCQANMTTAKVQEIQTALKTNGNYYGPIDGVVGSQTINAVQKYQRSKGLTPTRFLTIETVKSLGVNPTH